MPNDSEISSVSGISSDSAKESTEDVSSVPRSSMGP